MLHASRSSKLAASVVIALLYTQGAAALTEPGVSQAPTVTSAAEPAQVKPASEGLQPDQIYAVLVGEVAARRGDMKTACTHYMRAAELTRSGELAELAVRAAISGEDEAASERGISLWLDIAPDSPAARQVAAFLRIKAGDQEGALIHLGRLIDLAPEGAEAAFGKAAAIVTRLPQPEARVKMMRALVDRYPGSADAQHALAMVAASASQFPVAEQAAREAIKLRPGWSVPRLFLVRLLISEDKRPEARTLLEGFVNESPDDQALRMLYGQFLVEEQEFTTARDVFQRMLSAQPKEPDVLFAVGILSLQLDDLTGAQSYFQRLFETGERQDEAAFYLGQTAERSNDPKAALGWYGRVKGSNQDDAQVRIALLKAKQGDVAQAREILEQLRGESADEAVPLFMVEAEVLDEAGRPDEAMAVYNAALGSHPGDVNLLYARGLFAIKVGRVDEGITDLRAIIAADPGHADALNALGYTLADRTTQYQEAKALIERAHALKPDEPAILDSLGWVHYRLGELDKALGYLEQAIGKMKDGEIAAHLGEVLWALGRRTEARAVWDAALKDHPDHEYLQSVVGRYRVSQSGTAASQGAAEAPRKGADR